MNLIIWFSIFAVSIAFHEMAHALAAYWLGDDTAKRFGRLSLNPIRHLDPFWTGLFPLALYFSTGGQFFFAMARPVPVDFSRLHHPKKDMALVALAGPWANIVLAAVFSVLWNGFAVSYFLSAVYLNLALGLFNLIPIPPLDGSRVIASFLPGRWAYHFLRMEPLGYVILFVLYFVHGISPLIFSVINLLAPILNVPLLT